ncbi:MAG: peptidyl-prolyl cis-trans isomerase [Candidatus Omnitrophota bacterium]
MRHSARVVGQGMKWGILGIFLTGSILLLGCDKIDFLSPKKATTTAKISTPPVRGTVIAKVNNFPIALEELNRYINIYNASVDLRRDLAPEQKKALKIETRDKKIEYLKTLLVPQAVYYQAALDRGLDRKDEISEGLARYRMAVLAQAMQEEIVRNIEIGSAEVEDAYQSNKALFREAEVRRVREIVTGTEDEAKQILIELLQGSDFSSIARTRSIAESAKDGGDLGDRAKGQEGSSQAFDEIVFSPALLQQGQVSSVFKGPKGFTIVKVESIKEGRQVPLSEAFDTIKAYLLARKQQEELDKAYSKLSSESKIEIYEGEIK